MFRKTLVGIIFLLLLSSNLEALTQVSYYQLKDAPHLDVRAFGALGDGSTDDTAAFQAAIASASVGSIRTILLPKPSVAYCLSSKLTIATSGVKIVGDDSPVWWVGSGTDTLYQGMFQFIGTVGIDIATITADVAAYNDVATVSGYLSLSQDDLIYGYAPGSPTDLFVSNSNSVSSVASVSAAAPGQIILSPAPYPSLYVAPAGGTAYTFQKITPLEDCGVVGIQFKAFGQTVRSNGMGGIYAIYCRNFMVKDCSFDSFWFHGVFALRCYDITYQSLSFVNAPAVAGGEGYLVRGQQNSYLVASGLYGESIRHVIDETGSSHCTIRDSHGVNCGGAFSVHSAFEDTFLFDNCTADGDSNSAFDANSDPANVFGSTSDRFTYINCKAINCKSHGFSSIGLGGEFVYNNCVASLSANSISYAFRLSDNGAILNNCHTRGAIYCAVVSSRSASLPIFCNSCVMIDGDSNRTINTVGAVNVYCYDSDISGTIEKSTTSGLFLNSCRIENSSGTSFVSSAGDADSGVLELNGCVVTLRGSPSVLHYLYGSRIKVEGCTISEPDSLDHIMYLLGNKITVTGNYDGRFWMTTASTTQFIYSNNRSSTNDTGTANLRVENFSGRGIILGNLLSKSSSSTSAIEFVVGDSNSAIVSCIGNNVVGDVRLSGIATGTIIGNIFDSNTALPASSSSLLTDYNVDPNP